jgi:dienelactone hydrolase
MPATRPVASTHDGQEHEGLLVYDTDAGPRPTVLVFHDWSGRGPSQEGFAHRVAALGYNAFAVDLYGKGKRGETPDECQALMGPLVGDRALLRRRLLETVDVAAAVPEVDAARLAAIGFCFGGLCVLDLARAGGAVRGVASFHGLFTPAGLPSATPIKPKIVAYHGWPDPMAKPETVVALARELTDADADWQLHAFGGALHAFMVEGANMPEMGIQYDADAARRAWAGLEGFLAEVL